MAKRRTPEQAQAAFLAFVAAEGARFADGAAYVDTQIPVDLICVGEHPYRAWPKDVLRRGGLGCRLCRWQAAKDAFLARVAELGGELAEGAVYVDTQTPVDLICRKRHPCRPKPNALQQGQGICGPCNGNDREAAEAEFWALVEQYGARLANGGKYVDVHTPVQLVCAEGHPRAIRPRDLRRKGRKHLCSVCSGHDKAAAEAKFWALVKKHGARRMKGAKYVNSDTPVALVCAEGHRCNPLPGNVVQGHGICDRCRSTYDRVYLLVHRGTGAIKVGVTGHDARVRAHVGRGYRLLAQWTGLDHDAALATERAVLTAWRDAGIAPVPAAPRNGRSETAPAQHLAATRARLGLLLGAPAEDHPAPAVPAEMAA